ncbi:DUF3784 domain-containing protein [Wenyingzhuangia fucanilytica]|nr:DUF3784 domain-containing protein [Wenyingzhuangia fucanilytica]
MIYVFTGMSLLFIAIGFLVTENNAKYLLSGYNTMNENERKKVNLKTYIPYFKKFHITLGISFFVLGYLINLFNKNVAGMFLAIYPVLAYVYFVITSSKYSGGLNTKANKVGLIILIGTFIFVTGLVAYGYKENKILFDAHQIEFTGSYGGILPTQQIKNIEVKKDLPKITLKTNGFALGEIRKGYFKTKSGETVKLILNSSQKPYLLFTTSDNRKIYYSAKEQLNEELLQEIKKAIPNIPYKLNHE